MANCTKCGALLSPGTGTCEYCGAPAEAPRNPTTNPYASNFPDALPKFKASSVIVMLLLTAFTMGLYISIWYLMRRDGFSRLNESAAKKTNGLINALMGCHVALFALILTIEPGTEISDIAPLFSWVFLGLVIYTAFHIRGLLRAHAGRIAPQSAPFIVPSALLTLLFGCFYLQIHINRMLGAHILDLKA